MCVIIDRKAGAEISLEKIEIACDINKHGYGLVYLHKGHLKIVRSLKDNDHKEVYDLLQRHKDQRVWLHLRHATVGTVTKENSHPMICTTKAADGMDIVFMHNGTLHEYKGENPDLSDTYYFNEQLVTPLAKRCIQFGGLQDKFFQGQIGKALKYTQSVLLFVDSTGYVLRGNSDKGKEFEWGWASNEYSFDTQHLRSSTRATTGYLSHYPDNQNTSDPMPWSHGKSKKQRRSSPPPWESWEDMLDTDAPDKNGVGDDTMQNACLKVDIVEVSKKIRENWKLTEKSLEHEVRNASSLEPVPRKTFCELAGIINLDEVSRLSKEDFIQLCDVHPNAMAELYIDLVSELRKAKTRELIAKQAKDAK